MAKGRKPLSVGMKQNKEDFDRELKTYSTKALKNIITIAEKEITRRMCYLSINARNEIRTQNKKCVNCIVNSMGAFKT